MDWRDEIKARFVEAIKRAYPDPTPLIGPKWFFFPSPGVSRADAARTGANRPPDFQFLGARKLAKATGIPLRKVVGHLLDKLAFRRVDARVEVVDDWKINVWLAREGVVGPPRAEDPAQAQGGETEEKQK